MSSVLREMESLLSQQWIVETAILVFVTLSAALIAKLILTRVERRLPRESVRLDGVLVAALTGPVQIMIWIVGLSLAAESAGRDSGYIIASVVDPVRNVGIIAVLAWFLMRFIRRGEQSLVARHRQEGKPIDYTAVDAVAKLLRLTVGITAVLVTLQTLGFSIAGVLTFGGIGGIAVGFAARDLLANFFGGFMVYMDRPFSVGDWIRSPDREIEGVVEDIGWRITRIRTFENRPLYVPNATFASIALENPSRMQNRRIFETIGVRYQDADQVRGIVEDVQKMLSGHENIDQDQTLMVNFNAFASSSLDFFIYCFTRTVVWSEYHSIKQEVLLKVLDIISEHGAQCAFPTSTVHLFTEYAEEGNESQ